MSLLLKQLHFSCFIVLLFHISLSQDDGRLVTRLTHHHSFNSPFFDSKLSMKDRSLFDLKSSIYRASYLVSNTTNSLLHLTDLESELYSWRNTGFLVHLKVGSTNMSQNVYMDTASSLFWINCEPCGLNVLGPLFHPKESSTYEVEDCNDYDYVCIGTGAVNIECDSVKCTFAIQYGSAFSKGVLAREQFKFGISPQVLKGIVFGCSSYSKGIYANGVLGLGGSALSLRAQRGYTKFAYCLGNISDRSYLYSRLIIADKITFTGFETPLIVEDKYYINLERIEIGEITLAVDPHIFRRNSADYTGGMIVDASSTYTFMPQVVLKMIEAEVIRVIRYNANKNPYSLVKITRNESILHEGPEGVYNRLCYDGVLTRDLKSFPTVRFVFQGDASMEMIPENVFHQISEDTYCLGILPIEIVNRGATVNILGNVMQQYLYIAFDLFKERLAFKAMDCSAWDDYIL
ncbi:hypothetical protein ACP275_10G149000 [Erythranthe tilingii]